MGSASAERRRVESVAIASNFKLPISSTWGRFQGGPNVDSVGHYACNNVKTFESVICTGSLHS